MSFGLDIVGNYQYQLWHFVTYRILIDGLSDSVAPVTKDEFKLYEDISFDVADYKSDVGAAKLVDDGDKVKTMMARWRFNSLSIHGIQVTRISC